MIVDEAHHGRNPGTLTQSMLEGLGRLGESVLFLTATPIQLRIGDLFSLLNALRPAEFMEAEVLERTLQSHRGILEAHHLIRSRPTSLDEVRKMLLDTLFDTASSEWSPTGLRDLYSRIVDGTSWIDPAATIHRVLGIGNWGCD